MKKLTFVSLFIFWAVIVSILTTGLILRDNKNIIPNGQVNGINGVVDLPSGLVLTVGEVSKHNSGSNCWMIINNKVYDLTSFLNSHPGGASVMILYCGKDGTRAYNTKDKIMSKAHSQTADNLLASFYIGDLNQTVKGTSISTSTHPAVPTTFRGGEYDD